MPPLEGAHAAIEAGFAAAILDPTAPPPAGLLGRDGGPVGRRFAVWDDRADLAAVADAAMAYVVHGLSGGGRPA